MVLCHVWTCVVFVSLYKSLHTKITLLKGAHLASWSTALRVTWPFPCLAEHTTHFSLHFTTKECILFQFSNICTEELRAKSTSLQNFTENYAVNDGSSFPDFFHRKEVKCFLSWSTKQRFIKVVKQFITSIPQMVVLGEIVLFCSFSFSCFGAHGVSMSCSVTRIQCFL